MRFLVLALVCGGARAEVDGRTQLRAAVHCMDMPASLNPWGAGCEREVAKRWAECDKVHHAHPAAFDDCLGFKRPPPTSLLDAPKLAQLRNWAIALCSTLPRMVNSMGERCPTEVAERYERCGPVALGGKKIDAALMRCLGFDVPDHLPEAPKVLASCAKPRVHASVKMARDSAWPGSRARVVAGKTFHVAATPVVDERDIRNVTIEESLGERRAKVELTDAGQRRLVAASGANVGQYALIEADGWVQVPLIESAFDSFRFDVGERDVSRICP